MNKRIISQTTAIREIATELMFKYRYYDDVLFDVIEEAVENTIKDHCGQIPSLKAIHNHINKIY